MVSGMVLFVVGATRLLGWVLAVMQVPQSLASSVVGMGGDNHFSAGLGHLAGRGARRLP